MVGVELVGSWSGREPHAETDCQDDKEQHETAASNHEALQDEVRI